MNWVCLTAPPQKEFLAVRVLRQLGYEAVCPVELRHKRLSRRSRKRNKSAPPTEYPLLGARYFFGCFNGVVPMFELWGTGVVSGVISLQGRPVVFDPDVIKALAISSDYAMPHVVAPTPHQAFTLGQEVVVSSGPFTGHTSKIVNFRNANLASLVVQFLGSAQVIEFSLDQLEAA